MNIIFLDIIDMSWQPLETSNWKLNPLSLKISTNSTLFWCTCLVSINTFRNVNSVTMPHFCIIYMSIFQLKFIIHANIHLRKLMDSIFCLYGKQPKQLLWCYKFLAFSLELNHHHLNQIWFSYIFHHNPLSH